MKSRQLINIAAIILIAISAVSCNDRAKHSNLPAISGKAGEIAIVSTKDQWEAEPGTTIRSVLASEFPYIPQREPLYRLFNVPRENFNQIFKVHRNIVNVLVSDTCSTASMRVAHDLWASPQTVLLILAPNEIEAAQYISDHADAMIKVFEKAERDRSIANAKLYENVELGQKVASIFGGSVYFPSNYSLKKETSNFVWISYETSFTNQGIFIYRVPYVSDSQFELKNLIDLRDSVLKDNVPATREGSYMITNPNLEPGYQKKKYEGRDFVEIRSLWDTYNDYMGGPFISDAFLSPDGKEIIITEGFVYAPKYAKRDYLRQLEAILYSWHWSEK